MNSGSRIPSLDGLRAISITLVLLGHLGRTRNFPTQLTFLEYGAGFGVHIFFVISGFLITTLLLNEHAKTGTISVKEFYRRRALRILPAAYTYLLVMTIAGWSFLPARDIVVCYAYISNYFKVPWLLGHLWSLSIEEQFYLIWPFAMLCFFSKRKLMAAGTIIMAPVLRAVFYHVGWKDIDFYFPTVADAMGTGCLLAIVRPSLDRYERWLLSPWFGLVPIITISMLAVEVPQRRIYSLFYSAFGLTVMHTGIALCVDHAIRKQYWVLNWRPVVWVGVISYSLYLWQQPFLNRNSTFLWTAFPQNLMLAFLFAVASHRYVETPFLRIRERLSKHKSLAGVITAAESG